MNCRFNHLTSYILYCIAAHLTTDLKATACLDFFVSFACSGVSERVSPLCTSFQAAEFFIYFRRFFVTVYIIFNLVVPKVFFSFLTLSYNHCRAWLLVVELFLIHNWNGVTVDLRYCHVEALSQAPH